MSNLPQVDSCIHISAAGVAAGCWSCCFVNMVSCSVCCFVYFMFYFVILIMLCVVLFYCCRNMLGPSVWNDRKIDVFEGSLSVSPFLPYCLRWSFHWRRRSISSSNYDNDSYEEDYKQEPSRSKKRVLMNSVGPNFFQDIFLTPLKFYCSFQFWYFERNIWLM